VKWVRRSSLSEARPSVALLFPNIG
jgi:hypothetical protein